MRRVRIVVITDHIRTLSLLYYKKYLEHIKVIRV